ncbi:MAG: hypothetical protein AAFW68_13995, partial [Pseudomonadota bacterium]
MQSNEYARHGSAGLDDGARALARRLGRKTETSLYAGDTAFGQKLYSTQQSGIGLICGPRGGKGKYFIIPWLVDGVYQHHVINMDWKFQNGVVAGQQCFLGRHVINWNPRRAHFM